MTSWHFSFIICQVLGNGIISAGSILINLKINLKFNNYG